MADVLLGIDLGGTNVKAAVVDKDKQILGKDSRPTQANEGVDAVIDAMAASADAALAASQRSRNDVLAAGIGAPGPLNWRTGIVYSPPNLPGWKDVPLAKAMQERLGVPCFVENDANAACYGEYWLGAGQGTENMCLLTLGTGVGGGIVVHGKLLRGKDGTAGEIGHIKVARDGRPCNCGANGCLEAYGSVTGMLTTVIEAIQAHRSTVLTKMCRNDLERITGRMISQAAAQGDELAQWAIRETGIWLGIGAANLINLLNPEKIVLCGGMTAAGETLFKPIRETAKKMSFQVPADRCEIVPAGLGSDSGVIGAAGCALARHEESNNDNP